MGRRAAAHRMQGGMRVGKGHLASKPLRDRVGGELYAEGGR